MREDRKVIVIRGSGAISPVGYNNLTTQRAYADATPRFTTIVHQEQLTPVASLGPDAEMHLQALLQTNRNYKSLDRSVLLAVYASQQAATQAGWLQTDKSDDDLAVNVGSSRGATGLFEHHFEAFQRQELSSGSSPTTTLGNISSWVGQAVQAGGPQISHSITCSTALMALANGIAWMKAGMAKRFLAGGTEAPLTGFTIAQMKAIGIYSKLGNSPYPCQPYALNGHNTFVLGEGAAIFALEYVAEETLQKGDILIEAIGFGFERIESKTGISPTGIHFQKSMQQALQLLPDNNQEVDVIITHTPGTQIGDKAELKAIEITFKENQPIITNNKWMLGHTLGASGALSIQYALYLFKTQLIPKPFFMTDIANNTGKQFNRIMINAAGFGGNAVSVIIKINN